MGSLYLVTAGQFLVMTGRVLVTAGPFLVMAGRFLVMAGRFLVMAGRILVTAGQFLVMAGLEPAIPTKPVRTVSPRTVLDEMAGSKPGHADWGKAAR
jgi:hypothetical protein